MSLNLNYINNHLYFSSDSWNYSYGFCIRGFDLFISSLVFQIKSLAYKYKPLIAKFTYCAQRSGRKKKTYALASAQLFLWTGFSPVGDVTWNQWFLWLPRSHRFLRGFQILLETYLGRSWLTISPHCREDLGYFLDPFVLLNRALGQVPNESEKQPLWKSVRST